MVNSHTEPGARTVHRDKKGGGSLGFGFSDDAETSVDSQGRVAEKLCKEAVREVSDTSYPSGDKYKCRQAGDAQEDPNPGKAIKTDSDKDSLVATSQSESAAWNSPKGFGGEEI